MDSKSIYWSDEEFAELCGYGSFKELREHEDSLQREHLGGIFFKPVDFNILLRLPTKKEKTTGGIILPPENGSGKLFTETVGRIICFGRGAARHKGRFPTGPDYRPGELIHFPAHAVRGFQFNNFTIGHIQDNTIMSILTDDGGKVFFDQTEMNGMLL